MPGYTNRNYRLYNQNFDWVLRIPKPATDHFIDRDAEAHNQALVQRLGLAPQVAWRDATGISLTLKNFELRSATVGDDAQGEATVTVEFDGDSYRGHGTSVDIVEAASRAYLEVINRILRRRERGLHPNREENDINRASI